MLLFTFWWLLVDCIPGIPAALSSEYEDLIQLPNMTFPSLPSANGSNTIDVIEDRYYIPDTNLALDFYHQQPSIPREHVLMSLIEGLSKVFGHAAGEPLPGLSTFYYKRKAFVHIQDLNPTPGRAHTYGDMANTLRGIGEYMTAYNRFFTTEFQIWAVAPPGGAEQKIGSGGVGGGLGFEGTATVEMRLPAATSGTGASSPSRVTSTDAATS